ncbi:MAG: hypothetical protein ACKV2T_31965 [Kofleriaceae bacterium]
MRFSQPALGELAKLRELTLCGDDIIVPAELAKLSLDRLAIWGRWRESMDVLRTVPVRINITLIDGHPGDATTLLRGDLSAWRDLEELEIDAFENFRTDGLERKLPRCGFAINRKREVDWRI